MPNSIRYCYALLLMLAALALVVNPVWHAASHFASDHPAEPSEFVSDVQLSELERCPYCDAVSSFAEPPTLHSAEAQLIRQEAVSPEKNLFADLRFRISSRLRAPPALA